MGPCGDTAVAAGAQDVWSSCSGNSHVSFCLMVQVAVLMGDRDISLLLDTAKAHFQDAGCQVRHGT